MNLNEQTLIKPEIIHLVQKEGKKYEFKLIKIDINRERKNEIEKD